MAGSEPACAVDNEFLQRGAAAESGPEENMIPIVSIVGKSNSGKTTLIEKIIAELVRRGYRVATIKHNRHGFDIDHEGKDSWRHKRAGARTTVIASPRRVAVVEDVERDYAIDELAARYDEDGRNIKTLQERARRGRLQARDARVEAERVRKQIEELIKHVEAGDVPDSGYVARAIELLRNAEFSPTALREDILLTYRGRAIRP